MCGASPSPASPRPIGASHPETTRLGGTAILCGDGGGVVLWVRCCSHGGAKAEVESRWIAGRIDRHRLAESGVLHMSRFTRVFIGWQYVENLFLLVKFACLRYLFEVILKNKS